MNNKTKMIIGSASLIIIVILGYLIMAALSALFSDLYDSFCSAGDTLGFSSCGEYSAEYRCTNNLPPAQRRVTENPQDLWAIYELGVVQADDCLDPVSAKANFEWVVEEYAIRQETSNQLATRITEIQGALEVAEATLMDIEGIASNPSQFEPIPNSQWTKEQLAEAPEKYRLLKAKVQALSEELERLWAEADRTANLMESDSWSLISTLERLQGVDVEIFSREFSRELEQKCGPPSRLTPTRDEERIRLKQWNEEYSSCVDPLVEEFEKKMDLKREKYQSKIDDVKKSFDE